MYPDAYMAHYKTCQRHYVTDLKACRNRMKTVVSVETGPKARQQIIG